MHLLWRIESSYKGVHRMSCFAASQHDVSDRGKRRRTPRTAIVPQLGTSFLPIILTKPPTIIGFSEVRSLHEEA